MYAGDEFYGDDITSGVDVDEDTSYRAFCEQDNGCLWSGSACASDESAQGELLDHTSRCHPDLPIVGRIDESTY